MASSLRGLLAVAPELLLACAAIGVLVTARLWRRRAVVGGVTVAAFAAAGAALAALPAGSYDLFNGLLLRTPWIALMQGGLLAVMALVTLLTLGTAALHDDLPELFGLLLLSGVGLLLLTGAQSLIMVYVALELISLTSYLLTGFLRREGISAEAGLKYFLYGTLATGMLLYGVSWIYGATGTLDLPTLTIHLAGGAHPNRALVVVGALLLTVGLGFKVGLVPFHHWAPDAYEGAPTPIAAFISTGPKLAGFAVLLRLFWLAFAGLTATWASTLELLAILTMTLGNVAALRQTNVKRLLAYSSIAQAGYIVIGVVAASPSGALAVTYYTLAYVLMNLAAFACVIAVANATGGRDDLGAYAGLAQTHPVLAAGFALALLSLAGIPPLAGFLAKFWIFAAALDSGRVLLAVAAAVNTVIAVFYYALLLKQMYLSPPPPMAIPQGLSPQGTVPFAVTPLPLRVALGAALAGIVLLGLWPTPLLTAILATLPTP